MLISCCWRKACSILLHSLNSHTCSLCRACSVWTMCGSWLAGMTRGGGHWGFIYGWGESRAYWGGVKTSPRWPCWPPLNLVWTDRTLALSWWKGFARNCMLVHHGLWLNQWTQKEFPYNWGLRFGRSWAGHEGQSLTYVNVLVIRFVSRLWLILLMRGKCPSLSTSTCLTRVRPYLVRERINNFFSKKYHGQHP